MPEDHDSSSGTQNPNKGSNDAKGVTEQAKENMKGSSKQKTEKSSGDKEEKKGPAKKDSGKKDEGAKGEKKGDEDKKDSKPEGKKPEEPHAEQKQSDKHDIKGAHLFPNPCSALLMRLCCLNTAYSAGPERCCDIVP